VVGIETRVPAGRSGVQIPDRVRDFSLLHDIQTGSGDHSLSYSLGTGVLSWG
jgi:hypothetical protein